MIDSQLAKIKEWFSVYITKFHNTDADINDAIERKIHHTALVCDNVKTILESLDWSPSDKFMAEAAALLHDIGRFPQISNFGTFLDAKSADHGMMGTEVLLDESVLINTSGRDQRKILSAVKWHNKYKVPEELPEDEKTVLRIVRDADKLDIMRLFVEYYPTSKLEPHPILEFNLQIGEDCSEKIVHDILENRMGNISDIKNLNDLRLIKLSWIYDLYYEASKKIFKERNYIEETMKAIPQTNKAKKVAQHLNKYFEKI